MITGSSNVIIGNYRDKEDRIKAILDVVILHEGGEPAAFEQCEVFDVDDGLVGSGMTDEGGRLVLNLNKWGLYRITVNGYTLLYRYI